MKLEVLHVADCPNLTAMLERLRQVTGLPVTTREITTDTAAAAAGMAGSPTLLINGVDPFRAPTGDGGALACRIYRDENGHPVPIPSVAQLRAVLARAGVAPVDESPSRLAPQRDEGCQPGEVLRAWRARALPTDPLDGAAHELILRQFATTGHPPSGTDLAAGLMARIEESGRTTGEVLARLHDLDAIRLAPDGQVAVAYPFSARPTRHRVRIGDRVEVYAMCAIDALGVAPMLGQDTRIDSTDPSTGQPVRVTTTAGRTHWDPASAVVFLGATAASGPSAECCCDYLNFFANHTTATAWTAAHPHIPGQVLDQKKAETLAARLFGPLLGRLSPAQPLPFARPAASKGELAGVEIEVLSGEPVDLGQRHPVAEERVPPGRVVHATGKVGVGLAVESPVQFRDHPVE
jgi:hypothetical protein